MDTHNYAIGFSKGLELWSLQNILNLGMVLLYIATGLIIFAPYLNNYKRQMHLRLSSELWSSIIKIFPDLLLLLVFLIGLLTTNPDIMIDIKIAVPWFPIASLLAGWALLLRVFNQHQHTSRTVMLLLLVSTFFYWFGFTFVMEGATEEYYIGTTFPLIWQSLQQMRSDMNQPLTLLTFYCCAPLYAITIFGALLKGIRSGDR